MKNFEFLVMRRDNTAAVQIASYRARNGAGAFAQFFAEHPNAQRMGLHVVRKAKPSGEMMHVLDLASRQGTDIHWVPLVDGKGSQSRTVGRSLTIEACQRRGWLDYTCNLTQSGRETLHRFRDAG